MRTRMDVPAREVRSHIDNDGRGDTLPGLGGAYVVEVEVDEECSAFSGSYNVVLGTFTVLTVHDVDGEENYLLLTSDCMVTVEREDD